MSVQEADGSGSLASDLTSMLRIPNSYTGHRPHQSGRFEQNSNRGDDQPTRSQTEFTFKKFSTGSSRTGNEDIETDEVPRGHQQRANKGNGVDFQEFSTGSSHNGNQDIETDEVPRGHTKSGHRANNGNEVDFQGFSTGSRKTENQVPRQYAFNQRSSNQENSGNSSGIISGNEFDFAGFGRSENQNLDSSEVPQTYRHDTSHTPHSGNGPNFAGFPPAYRQTEHTQPNLQRHRTQSRQQQTSPRYPNYATKAARIASYRNWSAALKNVEEMAEGGFFHALSSNGNDCVRCFQCGIGLRNWDPEDDPWVEHARWSSKCSYLCLKKGQEFVDLVQAAVREAQIEEALSKNPGYNRQNEDVEADSPPITHGTGISSYKPSPTEKRNPLLTSAAQSVLDMGYLPRVVKKAVDEVLKDKGWNGMTGTNILQVVFKYEEELNRNKEGDMQKQAKEQTIKVPTNDFATHKLKTISKAKDKKTLLTENEEFKEQKTCKICCEEIVSIVFLPCGHLVCCAQCSPALKNCPVCRNEIKGTVRVCLADDNCKS